MAAVLMLEIPTRSDILDGFRTMLDGIPYVALLGVPAAAVLLDVAYRDNPDPRGAYEVWWFVGYVAMIAYVPSMIACGVVEWRACRRGWTQIRTGVRIVRWAHFLAAFGPPIGLVAHMALTDALMPF